MFAVFEVSRINLLKQMTMGSQKQKMSFLLLLILHYSHLTSASLIRLQS